MHRAAAGLTSAAKHLPGLPDPLGDVDEQTDFMEMFGCEGQNQHFFTQRPSNCNDKRQTWQTETK